MEKFNLFSLLGIKLLESTSHLSMNIYNVLFEVLVERMAHQIVTDAHPQFNGEELIIQNPGTYLYPPPPLSASWLYVDCRLCESLLIATIRMF